MPLFLQSDLRRFLIRVGLGSQQDSEVHEGLRLCTDSDDRNDEFSSLRVVKKGDRSMFRTDEVRPSASSDDTNYPHSRRVRTVPGDAPTALAISRKLAPCSRSRVISLLLTIRRGRPKVFPLSFALRSPALTRS